MHTNFTKPINTGQRERPQVFKYIPDLLHYWTFFSWFRDFKASVREVTEGVRKQNAEFCGSLNCIPH